ncbi:hypothetical protein GCM10009846_13010 [Agrococcus versicolor]|uniref:Transcription regulator PadR N-terminal domain-containing protein n=1 Tax=Agrococcus versicolor TaxID=501482 RepID=A0ABP5MEJ7_9MICO
MHGSFQQDQFDGGRSGRPGSGMWEAMEHLRSQFERKAPGTRMGRGDVRQALLSLLVEGPKHGYQLISEIEARSGGTWRPSPGSVYPTLQLLADEGLVGAEEAGGRKTYSLTEAGRAVADAAAEQGTPWASADQRESTGFSALPKAGFELAQAAAQVGRTGTPEQVHEAVVILEDARRRLYSILARD